MRVAIISDTHVPRFRARLSIALEQVALHRPDRIIHCGDLTTLDVLDAFATIAPIEAVAGNNDGSVVVEHLGRRKIIDFGAVSIGIVHGDGVRGSTLSRAIAAFEGENVNVIAFGHSHIPYVERHHSCLVINPGSITDKRTQARYSFATIEIADTGEIVPQLHYFD